MSDNYLKDVDIDQIKRAIQVEEKYKYINIMGRENAFSGFMIKQLRNIYKLSGKNAKWLPVIESFQIYPQENMLQRKRIIARFVSVLKQELQPERKEAHKINEKISLFDSDVVMLKGVGPKFGYLLNKLGIFSVFDLISYYPKKYIDYSSRSLIRELKIGENVTVYGRISALKTYTTKKNLTIIKVRIADESGFFELNFFYSKINRYSIERYKSQFPLGAGIIVSGCVKYDDYANQLTIDKPQFQIVNEESTGGENLNLGRIVPVYPLVENLNIKALRKAIYNALQIYKDKIENLIPDTLIKEHGLYDRKRAVEIIHFPDNQEQLEKARFSLVYEELFLLQLKLLSVRNYTASHTETVALNIKDDGLVQTFIKGLPFELTHAQKKSGQ